MTLVKFLVLIAVGIQAVGAFFYIRDVVSGKTKPNLVTWALWALAPLIGFFSAYLADADLWANARVFMAGFIPLIVFLIAICLGKNYWKITWFDIICGIFSLFAILILLTTKKPEMAILMAIVSDSLATLPTIKKAWQYPHTETGLTYIASFFSVALAIPTIPDLTIKNAAFPIQLLIANLILVFLVYRNYFKKLKNIPL